MFRSYLKTAWRSLWKHKGHTAVNLAGFAIGMACCVVILVYVRHERSFDDYHKDIDRVFRISMDIRTKTANRLFAPISDTAGPALKADYPQVEASARVWPQSGRLVKRDAFVSYEDLFMFADSSLFDVLTIPFVQGDPATALVRPATLVVSESMARKYFGGTDPVGKALNINGRDFEVTAVAADPPENTHLRYGLIASMATVQGARYMNNWHSTMFYTYLKLKPGVDAAEFGKLIANLADRYVKTQLDGWGTTYNYFLQPVRGLHLAPPCAMRSSRRPTPFRDHPVHRRTVRSAHRLHQLHEPGHRPLGQPGPRGRSAQDRRGREAPAHRPVPRRGASPRLFRHGPVGLDRQAFDAVPEPIDGGRAPWTWLLSPAVLGLLVGGAILVGLAAGIYPALVLSSFRPVAALQGALGRGQAGLVLRTVLVVLQFSVSSALILGTLFMNDQVRFMKRQGLGFDKAQKLVVPLRGAISAGHSYASVRNAFLGGESAIQGAALSSTVPGRGVSNYAIELVGEADNKNQSMFHLYFDENFVPLYGISIVAGRAFQKDMSTDIAGAFLINEAAVKAFGWSRPEEALGKRLRTGNGGRVLTIIGVTKDFHYRGLQAPVEPLAMEFNPGMLSYLTLQVEAAGAKSALAFVERTWKETFPERPFESFFLDDDFDRQYRADERVGRIFGIFMLLGLFIACLGLSGLASFTAASRTREIGIRKILGASSPRIVGLLSKQFAIWVFVASLLSWPAAYLFIERWLKGFASRTTLGAGTFVLSAAALIGLALLTTSVQTVRAALANPADSLRHE